LAATLSPSVIPAKTGIYNLGKRGWKVWIPTFVGMTTEKFEIHTRSNWNLFFI